MRGFDCRMLHLDRRPVKLVFEERYERITVAIAAE
jgi:hypothetical protein